MGYKTKYRPTLHLDFGYIGDNQGVPFFMEIKNPRLLTFDEKTELGEISKIVDKQQKQDAMKEVVRKLIITSNVLDKDTEATLNFSEENVLNHVPSEIVESIMSQFGSTKDDETKNS